MAEVIMLAERREARSRLSGRTRSALRTAFYFDLTCPYTYLAAERVDRLFGDVAWRPVIGEAPHGVGGWRQGEDAEGLWWVAARRAAELRIPLVRPDAPSQGGRAAMRAAAYAAAEGRGAAFALACSRLAFCGGYDIDDPEVLAEAAAVARIGLDECLAAARDASRDDAMEDAGRRLLGLGARRLPALRVGGTVFAGEERIAEALIAARARGAAVPRRVPAAG
jgi:2-hydroxychromene-2-carboxylate isomerase